MFKLGVITDEISQEIKEAAELAAQYGLSGVEIRSVWEKGPHELTRQDISNIKKILDDHGLLVCGISAPFFKCDIDNETEIKAHIEILKRSIELASELGTGIVRGFTFWAKGGFEDNLDKIASRFDRPVRILEREKVTLALEFDPSVFATNAKKLVSVIRKIDNIKVRGLWDPGNDIYDPDGERPYPEGYEIIKPYMVHMHLKDAIKDDGGRISGVAIGDGQVDYKGQFDALIQDSYSGWIVLETHYRPKHDIAEELMALPKGSAFSYLGYEATKECLEKLYGMIKWQGKK